jgi:hypothetical protein
MEIVSPAPKTFSCARLFIRSTSDPHIWDIKSKHDDPRQVLHMSFHYDIDDDGKCEGPASK